MAFSKTQIPYRETGAFSKLALDYIDQLPSLKPFFSNSASVKGIEEAIAKRQQFSTDRALLQRALKAQYSGKQISESVSANLEKIANKNCFTVTTAHQNNLFTGPLYFIYKILHAISLSEKLNELHPEFHFVPVYYMGTEDADFDELNHVFFADKKYQWETNQKGAVGRMKIDQPLMNLISEMESQLNDLPNGANAVSLLKKHYKEGLTVSDATFSLVNELFGEYGLLVLNPDHSLLKKQMIAVFKEELLGEFSCEIVKETGSQLEKAGYSAQAFPRAINLFYLFEQGRERIEKVDNKWVVNGTNYSFTDSELLAELENFPERFSPNVILRPIYQSTILPDVAFVGGGGEIAYWLQLQSVFNACAVPFPTIFLRNSYLIAEPQQINKLSKLGFSISEIFASTDQLLLKYIKTKGEDLFSSDAEQKAIADLYDALKKRAAAIDPTMVAHIDALLHKASEKLSTLDKKLIRSQKRKYKAEEFALKIVKDQLFPYGKLQERHENFFFYFAKLGEGLIPMLYESSLTAEQEFVIVSLKS
jgi:bacillithiol biosynthesis cysteine-adding enzyme BshC